MKLIYTILGSCTIAASVFAVDIGNLAGCINDVKQSNALPNDAKPFFSTDYRTLMMALRAPNVRNSFPMIYQTDMFDPFVSFLENLGEINFRTVFFGTPTPHYAFLKNIIPDISEAILQNGVGFALKETNAFQEVVSDLYDGYLSDVNRVSKETGRPIKLPDRGVLPPLVKWGNAEAGPYTWTAPATVGLQMKAAIVSLPPNNRKGGLLAWSTLPHETAGHDILHADNGLLEELGNKAYQAVVAGIPNGAFLANYWKQCIDETTSDVMGLLHGGPTVGMGLVGYFRGLMGGALLNVGYMPPADTHPVAILRGVIAAHVVGQMPFSSAKIWADVITSEVNKDLKTIQLIDPKTKQQYNLITENAILSAKIVADTICKSNLNALEGHSLSEIQNWNEQDQRMSEELAVLLQQGSPLPANYQNSGYFASHAVAGAIIAALQTGANVSALFTRMIDYLDTMHRFNGTWTSGVPIMPLPDPIPTPVPTPTPGQFDCDCFCECYKACMSRTKPAAPSVRLGTSAPVAMESMEMLMAE